MSVFEPLRARPSEHNNAAPVEPRPRLITEYSVLQKLRTLNPNKASGPDQIPSWLLKDNPDILAAPVADILNSSFQESRPPKAWKRADITILPKQSLVLDVNKHLRSWSKLIGINLERFPIPLLRMLSLVCCTHGIRRPTATALGSV